MKTSHVTLRQIATEAGVSVAAVSYALRGSHKLSAATGERVRAVARRLDYRPNARVAELMTHIRSSRLPQGRDTLALVSLEERGDREDAFARGIRRGAEQRAARRGLELVSFSLADPALPPKRLAGILQARGVAGVVFGPVQRRARVDLDWPWEAFPFAVIGMAEWNVPVSRAGHHHFEAMRLVVGAIGRLGRMRAACWIDAANDERAHRGWSAAWLASGLAGAARSLRRSDAGEAAGFRRAWLARLRPECLVVSNAEELAWLRAAGWRGGADRTFLLDWRPGCGASGVDQGYEAIAASAVDLVVEQLHHNERGLPDPPRMLLFPGRWRSAEESTVKPPRKAVV